MRFRVTFSLSFIIQSHFSCPFMHFRVTIFLSFGVQSHFSYSFRHLMPPSFFSLASRAIVHIPSGTLSHHLFMFWRLESFLLIYIIQSHRPRHSYPLALRMLPSWICVYPRFPHLVTPCLSPIRHCHFISPFSLLMTMSFEFTICISVMLLSTLHLSFSYSSLRIVSFWHILSRTSKVVRPLLILDMVFRVTFGDVLEEALVLSVASGTFWDIVFSQV